jgi:hypothetical protein
MQSTGEVVRSSLGALVLDFRSNHEATDIRFATDE